MEKILFSLLMLAACTSAERVSDYAMRYEPGMKVLADFCYGMTWDDSNLLAYNLTYPAKYAVQQIFLIYEEEWTMWGLQGMNEYGAKECSDVEMALPSERKIQLDPDVSPMCQSQMDGMGAEIYNCSGKINFRSEQPVRWMVVLARCGMSETGMAGMELSYSLEMKTGYSEWESQECYDNIIMSSGTRAEKPFFLVLSAVVLFKLLF